MLARGFALCASTLRLVLLLLSSWLSLSSSEGITMRQPQLHIRNPNAGRYVRVTQETDSLVIQCQGLLSPNMVRRIKKRLIAEYRKVFKQFNVAFDCYKYEGNLHIVLVRKRKTPATSTVAMSLSSRGQPVRCDPNHYPERRG